MTEWVRIRHPFTQLTAVVARRSFENVHSKPENGGWVVDEPEPENLVVDFEIDDEDVDEEDLSEE